MISSLCGELLEKSPSGCVISCGGVGFFVSIPSSVYGALPEIGGSCTLYTHLSVREDALELFGFETTRQREVFRRLVGVSGVGPKVALAILSLYDPDRIAILAASGDYKAFTACAGVGAKLAQRIVLELKDKLAKAINTDSAVVSAAPVSTGAAGDALAALVSLGFSNSEAASAIAALPQDLPAEELISRALRSLSSR